MGEFEVPGARLHTETRGDGPVLLLIHGGNGDCDVYEAVAGPLAEHFTVLSYVRRGFVRSPLDVPPDDATRIAVDAADAAALIAHHGGPAFVFGSSSGAVVALDLATRHPELVRSAVVHEPPLLALLADPEGWRERFAAVTVTYRSAGLWPAMAEFGRIVGLARPVGDGRPQEAMGRVAENMTFWMEHEFATYPEYRPDLDALAGSVVPAGGADSVTDISVQPPQAIAERLGGDVVVFPGGHVGYGEHPEEFGTRLAELLLRSGR